MEVTFITDITEFLKEKLDPEFIMLFGSQITGDTHDESDIDIAFYVPNLKLCSYELFTLAGKLSELTSKSVDLINLSDASTVFKKQIFLNGKPVYIKNEHLFNAYEINVYKMYLDLNEKRREVLKEIHESGNIYGIRSRHNKK